MNGYYRVENKRGQYVKSFDTETEAIEAVKNAEAKGWHWTYKFIQYLPTASWNYEKPEVKGWNDGLY